MRVSGSVWEGCGRVCASVTVWVCVGVRVCTWAEYAACLSRTPSFVNLWPPASGLPVSPRPGGLREQLTHCPGLSFPTPLITTHSQGLGESRITPSFKSHIQMSFPIRPHGLPSHLLNFLLQPCIDLLPGRSWPWAPLFSLPHPLVSAVP